jgi:hypothetical protein
MGRGLARLVKGCLQWQRSGGLYAPECQGGAPHPGEPDASGLFRSRKSKTAMDDDSNSEGEWLAKALSEARRRRDE